MKIPLHKNRAPHEIIEQINHYDSSGRAFKAISWLDYAKSKGIISALEYAALETRLAIEQLIFEQLVIGVGTTLDKENYKRCCGSAKKLSELINRLIPEYEKLIDFTRAIAPPNLPITKWDNQKLNTYSGKVSNYLHWSGGLDVTTQSRDWFNRGIETVEEATNYIWNGLTTGNTGVTALNKLEPEIFELWILYTKNKISLKEVTQRADALEPILLARLVKKSQ